MKSLEQFCREYVEDTEWSHISAYIGYPEVQESIIREGVARMLGSLAVEDDIWYNTATLPETVAANSPA